MNHQPHTEAVDQLHVIGDWVSDLAAIVKQWQKTGKAAWLAQKAAKLEKDKK